MLVLDRPIPIQDHRATTADYHQMPIDERDPRYDEPLVDVLRHGLAGENYYSRTDGRNDPYNRAIDGAIRQIYVRRTVLDMLVRVDARLLGQGIELFLLDGYRPVSCQRGIWDFFWDRLGAEQPKLSQAELRRRVARYVTDPDGFRRDDPQTWPAHATGGAVDLVLRDRRTGEPIEMGAAFDEMAPISRSDYFERALREGRIAPTDERLVNRRLLYWAMLEEGFTNYTYEYWHYDYGNQLHIMSLNEAGAGSPDAAWYGYVAPPRA